VVALTNGSMKRLCRAAGSGRGQGAAVCSRQHALTVGFGMAILLIFAATLIS